MKLRRGVTLEQLQDDLERFMGVQETRTEDPGVDDGLAENRIIIIPSTGKLMFKAGGKLYEITATEV